jgi:hypothetical protein
MSVSHAFPIGALAVVYMGHDRDVPEVIASSIGPNVEGGGHRIPTRSGRRS